MALNIPLLLVKYPPTIKLWLINCRVPLPALMTLLKLELFVSKVWVPEPLKFTVPLLLIKLPPVCDQVPDTFNVLAGAVNVPPESATLLVVTAPACPVNAPLLTVNPPLNVCVAVDAKYVPPETVVNNVTFVV